MRRRVLENSKRTYDSIRQRLSAAAASYQPSSFMLGAVVCFDALLVVTGYVRQHYGGEDIISSLTTFAPDGWCNPPTQGYGVHCWADYNQSRPVVGLADPWQVYLGQAFSYPAAALLPFLPFTTLGSIAGDSRVGLFAFLVAMLVGFSLPAFWASAKRSVPSRIAITLVLGIFTVPAMMAIDRGNTTGFLAPIVFLLLWGIGRDSARARVVAVVLVTMLKPQFFALLAIPICRRQWREAIVTIASAIAANVLAYLVWPANFPHTIRESIDNIRHFGAGPVTLRGPWPINASIARGLNSIEIWWRERFAVSTGETYVERWQNSLGIVLTIVVVGGVVLAGRRIPSIVAAMIVTASASLALKDTPTYYLVFALPFAAVLLRDPSRPAEATGPGLFDHAGKKQASVAVAEFMIMFSTVLSITRVLVPGTIYSKMPLARTDIDWISNAWVLTIVLVFFAAVRNRAWRPVEDESPDETAAEMAATEASSGMISVNEGRRD